MNAPSMSVLANLDVLHIGQGTMSCRLGNGASDDPPDCARTNASALEAAGPQWRAAAGVL